ncbi:efflux RND transporter permease subunit, partial [Enterobacter intestinihominis]
PVQAAFRFTINTLTMFGKVLAKGFLVDDAIQVVAYLKPLHGADQVPPKQATHKSKDQNQGRVVGNCIVHSVIKI